MFSFRIFAALVAMLICVRCSHAQMMPNVSVEEFSEIVEIARLPVAQQVPKVAQLYARLPELLLSAKLRSRITTDVDYPQLTPQEKQLSAKEQVVLAYKRGKWTLYVSGQSYELAREILRAHPDEVATLIHDDLRASEGTRQTRGLLNLWTLPLEFWNRKRGAGDTPSPFNARWFDTIYNDVTHVFQNAPSSAPADSQTQIYHLDYDVPVKAHAEGMLIQLGDARAIVLLIADNPMQPTLHYWAISGLARQHPNDVALQILEPMLRDDDAELRYRALFALPADNAATRTALPFLLEDADAKIRALAVSKAFELNGTEFENVKEQLEVILNDADVNVRWNTARGFAERGDAIAAPVLLKLWRDEHNSFYWWGAKSALAGLTGEKLDRLIFDGARVPQSIDWRDAAAFARVEAWIAAHPAY